MLSTWETLNDGRRSPVQGEMMAETKAGERHHKAHLRPGERHVQRRAGRREYPLDWKNFQRGSARIHSEWEGAVWNGSQLLLVQREIKGSSKFTPKYA